ncbi:MAG: ATP-dependent Clp protease ATP-binding subunit, partial [Armatimonadetes bacterium]|nr:ATP-dependent Clp protease ATP-binding subunit [Armatimonadota bacterium]
MEQAFTIDAWDAIAASEREAIRWGDRLLMPEHLLLGLLQAGDGPAARLLLRLAVDRGALQTRLERYLSREGHEAIECPLAKEAVEYPDGAEPEPKPEEPGRVLMTQRVDEIFQAAAEFASGYGLEEAGSEHLLVSLAGDTGSLAAWKLAQLGATEDRLRSTLEAELPSGWRARAEEVRRFDRDQPQAGNAAFLAGFGMVYLGLMWGTLLLVVFNQARETGIPVWSIIPGPLLLRSAWAVLAAVVLTPAYLVGKRWAWSACTGNLFVVTAASAAWAAMIYTREGWRSGDPLFIASGIGLVALAAGAVTVACFGSRGWFSIKRREGWRVLRREGGSALLLTGL